MEQALFEAVGLLSRVLLVSLLYVGTRNYAAKSNGSRAKAYLFTLVIALVMAFFTWKYYVASTEEIDASFPGGESGVFNELDPSYEARLRNSTFVFTVVVVTGLAGTYSGFTRRSH